MEGTRAARGEAAVYAAGYFKTGLHAWRAPVLDPGAILKRRGGGKTRYPHAVELFAVAPLSPIA
jgi:hypothetical protein